jgi:hypothetical protein
MKILVNLPFYEKKLPCREKIFSSPNKYNTADYIFISVPEQLIFQKKFQHIQKISNFANINYNSY